MITAQPDTLAIVAGSPAVTGNVLANDKASLGALTVTAVAGPGATVAGTVGQPVESSIGALTINIDGSYSFALAATPLVRGLTASQQFEVRFAYVPSVGETAGPTQDVVVRVTGVNDAPTVGTALSSATVNEGATLTIPLLETIFLDADNGAVLTLAATLASGAPLPSWLTFDAGARLFKAAPGMADSGVYTVRLTATDNEGARASQDFTLDVKNLLTGVVSDGYLRTARVSIDSNGNGVVDIGEPVGFTGSDGHFQLAAEPGPLLVTGGANIDTGLPNSFDMAAPSEASVVNPLTTIVAELMRGGMSMTVADAAVRTAFGLGSAPSFSSFDILASPVGDPLALAAQKAAVTVVALVDIARRAGGDTAEDVIFDKLVTRVGGAAAPIDFQEPGILRSLYNGTFNTQVVEDLVARGTTVTTMIATADSLQMVAARQGAIGRNNAPIANDDIIAGTEDVSLTFDLRSNDGDPDGGTLSVWLIDHKPISPGASITTFGGKLTLAADGRLTFTPNADFQGQPFFEYTVGDGQGGTATGFVKINVAPVPDAPRPANDVARITAGSAAQRSGQVLSNDIDVEFDVMRVTSVNGVTLINGGSNEGYAGNSIKLLGTFGMLQLNDDGTYDYELDNADKDTLGLKAGQIGVDSFAYVVRDPGGLSGSATLRIEVTGVNNAPTTEGSTKPTASSFEVAPSSGNFALRDDDGDQLSVVGFQITGGATGVVGSPLTGAFGDLQIDSHGFWTYAPDPSSAGYRALKAGQTGFESFTYTVSDGTTTTTGAFNRSWVGVNDAPTARDDNGVSVTEDAAVTSVSGTTRTNDSDPEGDALAVTAVQGQAGKVGSALAGFYGTLLLRADGTFTYTLDNADPDTQALNAGQTGIETFAYTIGDGALTSTAQLTIEVLGANEFTG